LSTFVCILRRDGAPLDPRDLHDLAEPLAGYGDETATFRRGPLGIAVRHRARPGARLRHGPLAAPAGGRVVAVAGRLEVPGDLSGDGGAAAWLAGAGDDESDRLAAACGSFAVVVADPERGAVRLAGDHLGGVAVHYHLDRHRLIAASDPAALLRHPAVSRRIDEAAAAAFLGFRFVHGGRSFFRDVRRLPPAHLLEVTQAAESVELYWRFRRLPRGPERSREEAAADLLADLRRSVARATAGVDPGEVALSLSGGLDSTAVAAVAPRGVRAFTWTFERTPEADERERAEAVARHLGLPLTRVPGDGLHPLCDGFADRFVHLASPFVNPFAALKCRLYEAARAAGCTRVLVGDGGDAPYAAREYWLRDLLADRRPGALGSLAATVRRAARGDRFAQVALRRLPPLDGLRRALRRDPPWLTAEARAVLPPPALSPILPPGPRSARHELAVGTKHGDLEAEEERLFARCGVERANPFWSWPLLERAIQLPAYRYHRDGADKLLSRTALRGLLPAAVVDGGRSGLLGSFFLHGIERRRDELRESVFRRPRSDWQRWVRREWVERFLDDTRSLAFGHTILWRVIGYELWQRRLDPDRS
jgi:asparagine synthase (glutamine-hydrolysing)